MTAPTPIAYAGDLQGQLWKFNLSGPSEADWGVSSWNGSGAACRDSTRCEPFFVAMDSATPARRQAITTTPLWLAHPLGGIQLMFGTGRHLQLSDAADAQVQTIYSVWDKSGYQQTKGRLTLLDDGAQIGAKEARDLLVRQEVGGTLPRNEHLDDSTAPELSYTTEHTVPYTRGAGAATKRGWFLDLPQPRERVLQAPVYFEGQKAIIASMAPADVNSGESCEGAILEDGHWLTVLNMISGWSSATPVFGVAATAAGAQRISRMRVKAPEFITLPGSANRLDLVSVRNGTECTERACTDKTGLLGANGPGVRMDWREIQR